MSRITIGITCYHEGAWLRDCWESVLAQEDDRWEAVLVLDGGGDAATREIFDSLRHDRIVDRHVFDRNVGPYAARNKAFALTRTPYHFYLDGDDQLPPDAVSTVLSSFAHPPEPACVYGDYLLFGGVDEVLRYPSDPNRTDWARRQCAPGPCAYSVAAWRDVGGFYEGALAGGDADHDFHLSLVERGLAHRHCGKVFYRYRSHHPGRVSSRGMETMYRTRLFEAERHSRLFSDPALRASFVTTGFLQSMVLALRADDFPVGHALAREFFDSSSGCDRSLVPSLLYWRCRTLARLPAPAARAFWTTTRWAWRAGAAARRAFTTCSR